SSSPSDPHSFPTRRSSDLLMPSLTPSIVSLTSAATSLALPATLSTTPSASIFLSSVNLPNASLTVPLACSNFASSLSVISYPLFFSPFLIYFSFSIRQQYHQQYL